DARHLLAGLLRLLDQRADARLAPPARFLLLVTDHRRTSKPHELAATSEWPSRRTRTVASFVPAAFTATPIGHNPPPEAFFTLPSVVLHRLVELAARLGQLKHANRGDLHRALPESRIPLVFRERDHGCIDIRCVCASKARRLCASKTLLGG